MGQVKQLVKKQLISSSCQNLSENIKVAQEGLRKDKETEQKILTEDIQKIYNFAKEGANYNYEIMEVKMECKYFIPCFTTEN